MTLRHFVAGILGGIAMFIWTSIAHMALPLGEAGIREIPNEEGVLEAMKSSISNDPALYIFPGLGVGANPSRQQKGEAMKQLSVRIIRSLPAFSCTILLAESFGSAGG
jgi:hypothetical protein